MKFPILTTFLLATATHAADLPKFPLGTPCIIIEPTLMGAADRGFAPTNSKKTLLVPAQIGNFGPEIIPATELLASWPDYLKRAQKTSETLLASLKPKITRDTNGIAQMAVYKSDHPLTASLLLAPGLLKKFEKTLGDKLLAAIPDRHSLYLFPRSIGNFRQYGKQLASTHQDATYPASIELFEISDSGLKAVGSFLTE